jgi:hypothetical protein
VSTRVYDYDVLWNHSCTRIVSPIVKVLIWVWECLPQYDMILYMYFVLKIAGSDRALRKMILEMIKYFTLPIWFNTLIYYRLRTLGGNLLHWNLSPWLSAVNMAPSIVILSSLSSLIPLLFMSNFKKRESHLKTCLSLGTQVLSTLPACTHPKLIVPAYLYAL